MPETAGIPDFNSPVAEHARKDFPLLDADRTVAEALDRIRREGVGEPVIYFFAVDSDKRRVGSTPTRRLSAADATFADRASRNTPPRDHGPSRHSHSRHCIRARCLRVFRALQIFRLPGD